MENNRSKIVIIAIVLATFAAGALVWFLARPADEVVDVAQQEEQPIFDSTPEPTQIISRELVPVPQQEEQQVFPEPQVAAAVSPSAQTGPAEITLALIVIGAIVGAMGLRKFTTA
ncbi:MAG: hypothetical protein WD200_04975 [Candidatus Andersenbacteria bacterium]